MSEKIRNLQSTILNKGWSELKKVTYEFRKDDGEWETQVREAYDRGNGVTILLFNSTTNKIILTRQFRLPTFLNGNKEGMMIEACAGKLEEGERPDECIIREVEEETGLRIQKVEKIFESYMSPGSVTELIHFYVAPYESGMKVSSGGGKESEQENIDVLEMDFKEAWKMVNTNEIKDAKTIMLLQFALINGIVRKD